MSATETTEFYIGAPTGVEKEKRREESVIVGDVTEDGRGSVGNAIRGSDRAL